MAGAARIEEATHIDMKRYSHYINGRDVTPTSQTWFETFNPFTSQAWAEIAQGSVQDADLAVRAAHDAFTSGPWASLTATQRGALLRRVGDLIARDARRLAELEVRDNGKLLAEMLGQLNYIPQWFYYFGGLADKVEGRVIPLDKPGYFNFTRREPLGVVAAITPWNSPLLLATWKIAPALAAGCTVVIKPSEFTSASTLEFARLFEEAGFPPGVVNVVTGFGKDVGATLVDHPLVAKITFTGADATGRAINEAAARQFKHVSLELGGSRPTSSSRTRSWTTPSMVRSPASSPRRARPASPARACWCRTRSTTRSLNACWHWHAPRAWAIPCRWTPRSVR
jgi:acyl-CoA reductase-like NAD-dependent aldehyde dehydrogenase